MKLGVDALVLLERVDFDVAARVNTNGGDVQIMFRKKKAWDVVVVRSADLVVPARAHTFAAWHADL